MNKPIFISLGILAILLCGGLDRVHASSWADSLGEGSGVDRGSFSAAAPASGAGGSGAGAGINVDQVAAMRDALSSDMVVSFGKDFDMSTSSAFTSRLPNVPSIGARDGGGPGPGGVEPD